MNYLFNIILVLHILAGFISLIAGPVAFVYQKNRNKHRQFGKYFFYGMTVILISALIMAMINFNPFLLMLAIFSYYSVFTGFRFAKRKNKKEKGLIDKLALVINSLACTIFVGWGILSIINYGFSIFPILAVSFGIIGLNTSRINFNVIRNPNIDQMNWIEGHISAMIGGYVATLTAFSATTLTFLPEIISWTWPSLFIIPISNYWIRKNRKVISPEF